MININSGKSKKDALEQSFVEWKEAHQSTKSKVGWLD
jgi:hypothetical protein